MKMVAKGISQDEFLENGVGRQSNRSFRMRTMTVREVLQHIRLGGLSHIFTDTSVVYYRKEQVLF